MRFEESHLHFSRQPPNGHPRYSTPSLFASQQPMVQARYMAGLESSRVPQPWAEHVDSGDICCVIERIIGWCR